MTELARAIYAVAPTKRRRYLWCVWWTGAPTVDDFRPPDAWGGGATSQDEARAMAERAAGRPLRHDDGPWAGAWRRVMAGLPPFPKRTPRPPGTAVRTLDPHLLLGVAASASLAEVKAAYRAKVLDHHPDRGGDPEVFIALKRAYDTLRRRHPRRAAT